MAARVSRSSGTRRNRSSIPTLLATMAGTAALVLFLTRQQPGVATDVHAPAPVVSEFDVVSLPVPAEYVPAGKKIKEVRFRNVSFPKHQVPVGALTSLDTVKDGVTLTALPANLPLFAENFSASGVGLNPVVESIPHGMRAMTVRVDATTAVEGWAGSGSVVDVLLVEKDRTTVVAEKVKVLSAERSVSPVEGAAAPNVPTTVTLLVTQEQCLAINTAIPRGKIAFALRSAKDEENWDDTVFTAEKLHGLSPSERKAVVNGFVSIKGQEQHSSFALTDGKWTKTSVVPDGFMRAKPNTDKLAGEE